MSTMTKSGKKLWVIITLQDSFYAINAHNVKLMTDTPQTYRVPGTPRFVRGIINFRGRTMSIVDLRLRFNMPDLITEMNDLLTKREQDHHNWINELESSVKEHRPFLLTTDPHKCAFGKWYDSYKASNLILITLMKKFDAPHKAIHKIGESVLHLEQKGEYTAAYEIIKETRDTQLAELSRLFMEFKKTYSKELHEVTIILETASKTFAIVVDSIDSVGYLKQERQDSFNHLSEEFLEKGIITGIAQNERNESLVMILDPEKILP